MPGCVRVVPEDLHLSSGRVEAQAEELHACHTTANARMEAARSGVPASASLALGVALATWQSDTTVLHGNMAGHSQALAGAAAGFQMTEDDNTARVGSVGVCGAGSGL